MPSKPRTYVQAPSFSPLPFGLLSSLSSTFRNPSNSHWQFGVNYEPVCAQGGTTFGDCFAVSGTGLGAVGEPTAKAATTAISQRGATPFTVFAEVDCSAPGFFDRAEEIIGDAFTQSEQWQVERAFWTGLADGQSVVYPHLAANTAVVDDFGITLQIAATTVSGGVSTPLDIVEALGFLESELADCYDGVGVIHAPRVLLPSFAEATLITRENDHYVTPNGNIVVFGAGYPGTSPAGASSSGSVWMYATGAMFIYRSDVSVLPVHPTGGRGENSFSRANNTVKAIAERTYVIGWDCCLRAVNVTTGGIGAGLPSSIGAA